MDGLTVYTVDVAIPLAVSFSRYNAVIYGAVISHIHAFKNWASYTCMYVRT